MNNLFATAIEQTQPFLTPVAKANKLVVANLEKVVTLQMDALHTYVDLGLKQLKAAAEISGPEGLKDFYASQLEVAGVVRQQVMDDVKALTELGADVKAQCDTLTEENVTELTQKVAEVTKAA